jgi:hypothetical protein
MSSRIAFAKLNVVDQGDLLWNIEITFSDAFVSDLPVCLYLLSDEFTAIVFVTNIAKLSIRVAGFTPSRTPILGHVLRAGSSASNPVFRNIMLRVPTASVV